MTMSNLDSAVQDDWTNIAQLVRLEITKRIPDIGAMKPDEIEKFADAMRSIYWLEEMAHTFDKRVELELAKVTA